MFELVLLKADREEFVELFLDEGFYIHRYLDRNSILELFRHGENREFFVTVILQSILGHFAVITCSFAFHFYLKVFLSSTYLERIAR